jgi:predicted 3-demethylubiquinone-9 3-methyltransferase (glyoxalase superfamily)
MNEITACLWFDDQAEEAADFYTSVFDEGRILEVTRYGPGGPGPEGSVVTVAFELDGRRFLALNGGPRFTFDEAVSFQIACEDQEQVDRFWKQLSTGGEEGQCGWLKDRFGLSWQVVPTRLVELLGDPDPGRAQRATEAMLAMRKIDIGTLERAADGAGNG